MNNSNENGRNGLFLDEMVALQGSEDGVKLLGGGTPVPGNAIQIDAI